MKSAVSFLKNQHSYKCDIDFIGLWQFNKQSSYKETYVFDTMMPVFALFRQQKTF